MRPAGSVSATDRVQFTFYELVTKTGKKTTYSLKKLKSYTPKSNGSGSYVATDMSITLKAGANYYFSVKSTNASKGGNAEYFVFVPGIVFNADALSMPEASAGLDAGNASSSGAEPSALDVLSFGQYDGGTDVLADVSAVSGFDSFTNDGSAWQNVAKLA